MIQATKWQAQLSDGSKLTGGQNMITDVNVSAVPIDQVKVFTVAHNTFSHTYYAPTNTWYKDGKPWNYLYPTEYVLADGSLLTVDTENGLLKLKQL